MVAGTLQRPTDRAEDLPRGCGSPRWRREDSGSRRLLRVCSYTKRVQGRDPRALFRGRGGEIGASDAPVWGRNGPRRAPFYPIWHNTCAQCRFACRASTSPPGTGPSFPGGRGEPPDVRFCERTSVHVGVDHCARRSAERMPVDGKRTRLDRHRGPSAIFPAAKPSARLCC